MPGWGLCPAGICLTGHLQGRRVGLQQHKHRDLVPARRPAAQGLRALNTCAPTGRPPLAPKKKKKKKPLPGTLTLQNPRMSKGPRFSPERLPWSGSWSGALRGGAPRGGTPVAGGASKPYTGLHGAQGGQGCRVQGSRVQGFRV